MGNTKHKFIYALAIFFLIACKIIIAATLYYAFGLLINIKPKTIESEYKNSIDTAIQKDAEQLHEKPIVNPLRGIELHFDYTAKINSLYKERENPRSLQECIDLCKKDIALFSELNDEFFEQNIIQQINDPQMYEGLSLVSSFERLAIIYEKQGYIEEALEISELALKYGVPSIAKTGFEGRLARLHKKVLA